MLSKKSAAGSIWLRNLSGARKASAACGSVRNTSSVTSTCRATDAFTKAIRSGVSGTRGGAILACLSANRSANSLRTSAILECASTRAWARSLVPSDPRNASVAGLPLRLTGYVSRMLSGIPIRRCQTPPRIFRPGGSLDIVCFVIFKIDTPPCHSSNKKDPMAIGLKGLPSGLTTFKWSGREDSNLRLLRPERSTLPG